MNYLKSKFPIILVIMMLLLVACNSSDNNQQNTANDDANQTAETSQPTDADTDPVEPGALDAWLQQVKNGEVQNGSVADPLAWNLGYFLYYGELESIGIDNLIYNALEAHRRLSTGEVTQATQSQNDQNLMAITDGLQHNPDVALTEQIGQTPEIKAAILAHVVDNQQNLSPEEALNSGTVIGFFGPPAPQSIGGKYLVFKQNTPDADFEFLGVIIAVDATSQDNQQAYSVGEWQSLVWLGDASGPFWNDLPAGSSGDPASTGEGRPGVLLISEATYREMTQ